MIVSIFCTLSYCYFPEKGYKTVLEMGGNKEYELKLGWEKKNTFFFVSFFPNLYFHSFSFDGYIKDKKNQINI